MSFSHSGSAARACAPIFRKTPPHVHPIINVAADVCPVLPKLHPSRNLNSMNSSLWNKFEKECPFAKVVQKNMATSSAQTSAPRLPHVRPQRICTRSQHSFASEQCVCPVHQEAPVKTKAVTRTSFFGLCRTSSPTFLPSRFLPNGPLPASKHLD